MKSILLIAASLEVLKGLLFLAFVALSLNLPDINSEILAEVLAITLLLLLLPEMLVSYEHGPHGFWAYLIMCISGAAFNLIPAMILLRIYQGEWLKARFRKARNCP